ncbi:MAG: asparaginase domain-containing protein [Thermoanaerobaculia bacterium]
MKPRPRFARGGAIRDGDVYVERPGDADFGRLARESGFFTVSGCRTMGKTSLVNRWRSTLKGEGIDVMLVDVAGLGTPPTLAKWFSLVERELAATLGALASGPTLPESMPPARRFLSLLEHARGSLGRPVVLVLDEIDWIKALDYGQQILAAVRAAQTALSSAPINGVTVCLMGLRAAHQLGESLLGGTSSPIGPGVRMRDFELTSDSIEAIAEGFDDLPISSPDVARYLLEQTGGQPFLTMALADEINHQRPTSMAVVESFVASFIELQRARKTDLLEVIEGFFLLNQGDPHWALRTYDDLIHEREYAMAADAPGAPLLLLSGLVREQNNALEVKGPIFRHVFDEEWVRKMYDRIERTRRQRRPKSAGRDLPRVFVLNTGGTIGMVRQGDKVVPAKNKDDFLLNYGDIREVADIEFEQPFEPLDSINVTTAHWGIIAREIYQRRHEGYAGFVVAHGTDTMAFTASAVAFALGEHLPFPVVFTGAQATPDVQHGDARLNILRACIVASQQIPEVVICFGNHVFRAVRAQKKDERRFDGFESVVFPPLAEITEIVEIHSERIRARDDSDNPVVQINEERIRELPVPLHDIQLCDQFASGILLIQLTPSLEPEFYRPALDAIDPRTGKPTCRGVIIQTLGAGNVTTIEPYGFMGFIADAVGRSIPVLITSPYPWRPAAAREFAPAAAPIDVGAIPGGEMTTAAAVTKFRWSLARVDRLVDDGVIPRERRRDEISALMQRNLIGELA